MKIKKVGQLALTFLKIGAFTFGGGYAMLAFLETEFVSRRQWMTMEEFMDMTAIAESTPGPMAVNSATYIGYRVAGPVGALVATLAVCLPSFVVIYILSFFFDRFLSLTYVAKAFRGIQAGVVYLIFSAGLKMLRSIEKNALSRGIAAVVMLLMVVLTLLSVKVSSLIYILLSGLIGLAVYGVRVWRQRAERPEERKRPG